jgi:O-antigen/teichoic acid export membrane protein
MTAGAVPASAASPGAVVARGAAWIGGGHVVRQVGWFGSLLVVAALVPPQEFGRVAAAMVFVQAAWTVVNSGTRGSIVVGSALTAEQFARAVRSNVVTGTAIAGGAVLLAGSLLPAIIPGADPLVLQVLAVTIVLNGLSIAPLALLQREMRFREHASANAAAAIAASVACVAAAVGGAGVWALVARQLLFQLVLAWLAWRAAAPLARSLPRRAGSARRDPTAKWFFATTLIAFATFNLDNAIVGHFTSVRELGLYSLAFAIAFAPVTQFAWQVGTVLQPAAARTARDRLGPRARTAVRVTALLLLPCAAPAIVLAPVVLTGLLGPRWAPMVLPFQLLVAAGIVQALLVVLRQFLVASGSVRFCAAADGAGLAVTIVALVLLVQAHGIAGAAIAHAGVAAAVLLVYGVWGMRRLGSAAAELWASVRGIALPVGLQGVVSAAWALSLQDAGLAPGVVVVLATVAGFAAFAVTAWVSGLHPAREVGVLLGHPAPRAPRRAPQAAMALAAAGLAVGALVAGAAAVLEPRPAIGLAAAALALLLAFRRPVATLLLLLAVMAIVPPTIQASLGSGGDVASAGVLPSDLLLVAVIARAAVVLPGQRLPRKARWAVGLMAAFLGVVALQVVHAIHLGRPISGVGGEFRVLLAFGTLLAAIPLLLDPGARRRLVAGLPVLGLVIGTWGVAQFALGLHFDRPDLGTTVATFATAGRVVGQLAFLVAAVLSLAALTGAPPRAASARLLLLATFVLNTLAIVLTFERTMMLVALVGFGLLFALGTGRQRVRILTWAVPPVVVGIAVVGITVPGFLPAYAQRLSSLGALSMDPSVHYRIAESRVVGQEIAARPITGSGLGATILIGRPGTNVPVVPRRFAENGYQWLAWKLGLPGAALLWAILALAIVWPLSRREAPADAALVRACRAALAALAIATLTFPSFNDAEVAPIAGVLAALALCRPARLEVTT